MGAAIALGALHPIASHATDDSASEEPTRQAGEDRWVPSLAITSGVTIQKQKGSADSLVFEDMNPNPIPLQGFFNGDDIAVSPFVGGALELMAPALPIPTKPRLFVSGEILPTFASDRDVVIDGDPSCVRGPKPGAPCARDGGDNFSEDSANGEGTKTTAQVDTLVFGASLGAAFPLQLGERQLRIKPSVAWINYKIDADGLVVNANCDPTNICTGVGGFLRETILTANDSQRFNGIGPGLDIEMDTVQYGPLGVSLFLGGRAYAIVGDRDISFGATKSYDDQLGTDDATALFEVKVDPWMFRAHVGIRFHYLGNQD
jgi:hypothetical protein